MKTLKKRDFPSKICKNCGLEFLWRKKWKNNWDEVLYCSKKCSSSKT